MLIQLNPSIEFHSLQLVTKIILANHTVQYVIFQIQVGFFNFLTKIFSISNLRIYVTKSNLYLPFQLNNANMNDKSPLNVVGPDGTKSVCSTVRFQVHSNRYSEHTVPFKK